MAHSSGLCIRVHTASIRAGPEGFGLGRSSKNPFLGKLRKILNPIDFKAAAKVAAGERIMHKLWRSYKIFSCETALVWWNNVCFHSLAINMGLNQGDELRKLRVWNSWMRTKSNDHSTWWRMLSFCFSARMTSIFLLSLRGPFNAIRRATSIAFHDYCLMILLQHHCSSKHLWWAR